MHPKFDLKIQLATSCALLCICASSAFSKESFAEQARRIHREAYVMDTHSDTTPKFEEVEWDFSVRHEEGHMDLPRLREGGYDAVFWSIYMGKTEGDGAAIKKAIRRMDSVHELVRKYPDDLLLATTAADIRRASRESKVACLMGVEGGHIIEGELAALRTLFRLGARYMTLTHSFNTPWADSSGTGGTVNSEHDGLTDFGEEIVVEMNRLGMMIDVSHVSDDTYWDVVRVSEAPIIASHSSVRELANHPRNMTDKMLKALAKNGGVIQINFYNAYIDPVLVTQQQALQPRIRAVTEQYFDDPKRASEERRKIYMEMDMGRTDASVVIDHIEHVIRVAGDDHVGLGADWDGVPAMPNGLEDCSKVNYITEELLRRGHSEETIKKVLGGNMLRVMEEVEAVSAGILNKN